MVQEYQYTVVVDEENPSGCKGLHSRLERLAESDRGIVYVWGIPGPPETHSLDIDGVRVDLIPGLDERNVEIHASTVEGANLMVRRLQDTLNIKLRNPRRSQ